MRGLRRTATLCARVLPAARAGGRLHYGQSVSWNEGRADSRHACRCLPKSCGQLRSKSPLLGRLEASGRIRPILARFWTELDQARRRWARNRPSLGRCRPKLARTRAILGQSRTKLGQTWPGICQFGAVPDGTLLLDFVNFWATSAKCGSTSASVGEFGHFWLEIGPDLVECAPQCSKFAQPLSSSRRNWPNSLEFGPHSSQNWPKSRQSRPTSLHL